MSARIKLSGLEALRFFAATAIVVYHVVHFGTLTLPQPLDRLTGLLGFGVPLFYIVSAFGLYVGYAGRLSSPQDLRDFYLRRFFRIAPLFYLLMVITFLWIPYLGGAFVSPARVLTSLLFVFNLVPGHETGFVMASWSIGVEMLFYAIFPLIVFAVTTLRGAFILLALSAFLASIWTQAFAGAPKSFASFGNFSLMSYSPYFAAGIVGYFIWRAVHANSNAAPIGRAMTLLGLCSIVALAAVGNKAIPMSLGPLIGMDNIAMAVKIAWAAALAAVVVGTSLRPEAWIANSFTCTLGQASFSLYLWHPVILTALKRSGAMAVIKSVSTDHAIQLLAISAVTLAILFPVSILSYRYIEKPGMNLVRRFQKHDAALTVAPTSMPRVP